MNPVHVGVPDGGGQGMQKPPFDDPHELSSRPPHRRDGEGLVGITGQVPGLGAGRKRLG